jgi:hypothetical protein
LRFHGQPYPFRKESDSDWGQNELISYRITVSAILPQQFFRQGADPPLTGLDPALITAPLDGTNVSYDTCRFLTYLNFATPTLVQRPPSTTWLVSSSAQLLGFEEHGFALRTGYTIPAAVELWRFQPSSTDGRVHVGSAVDDLARSYTR